MNARIGLVSAGAWIATCGAGLGAWGPPTQWATSSFGSSVSGLTASGWGGVTALSWEVALDASPTPRMYVAVDSGGTTRISSWPEYVTRGMAVSGRTVFAATASTSLDGRVLRSSDGGAHWTSAIIDTSATFRDVRLVRNPHGGVMAVYQAGGGVFAVRIPASVRCQRPSPCCRARWVRMTWPGSSQAVCSRCRRVVAPRTGS